MNEPGKLARLGAALTGPGRPLAFAIIAAIALLRGYGLPPFEEMRLRSFDLQERLVPRQHVASRVVIVAFDEASLASRYGPWPWPNALVAELVRKITSGHPAAFGVKMRADILFADPSRATPERDGPDGGQEAERLRRNNALLADAFRSLPAVVPPGIAFGPRPAAAEFGPSAIRFDADPRPFLSHVPSLAAFPPALAADHRPPADINSPPDPDGIVRRVPLFIVAGDTLVAGFSVELLRLLSHADASTLSVGPGGIEGAQVGPYALPVDGAGRAYPWFARPKSSPIVSAAGLLSGAVDPARLKDEVVLLGVTGLGLVDVAQTPVGLMSGAEIQAQLIECMLGSSLLLRPVPLTSVEIAIAVGLSLVVILALPYRRPLIATGGLLAAIAVCLGGAFLAFRYGHLLLDGTYPALSSLAAFGIVLGAETRAAERGRRALAAELQQQREREAQIEARRAFVATISHEIRTPLNGVLGTMELLRRSKLSAEQSELVTIAHEASSSLIRIVGDILDFSKIEAGKLEVEKIPLDPRRVIATVARALLSSATEKGLQLQLMADDRTPAAVVGDPVRLRQVLFNLVGNAIKFTARGTVAVRIRPGDGTLVFEVEDTGIGLTAEEQARLFTAFQQAGSATARRYGGTGLGLSICRGIVDAMAGRIEVESEKGRGSVFRVIVPAEPCDPDLIFEDEEADLLVTIPLPKDRETAERQGRLVLLAEDNPINQRVIRNQLEHLGFWTDVAPDGRAAVEACRTSRYAVVFMDHQMPGMDGFQATAAIRALERGTSRHVPIVALTANATQDEVERSAQGGMDDFCAKPVTFEALAGVLRAWVPAYSVELWTGQGAEPAASAPVLADGKLVDEERIQRSFGPMPATARKALLQDFLTSTRPLIERLVGAARARDLDEACAVAHAAKGAARTVGAERLAGIFEAAERGAKGAQWEHVDSALGPVAVVFTETAAAIEQL
ncbi:MAG: CHASE2 domain-containing protein [Alphaproteobacteria bacterium]|nr:CHASE2 domain-containing protein [Alphaproteobacteria bacterium]